MAVYLIWVRRIMMNGDAAYDVIDDACGITATPMLK